MQGLLDHLAAGEILVADGATGTYLMARGLEPGACPDECNLSHPDWLSELARLYAEAGSDFVVTNTFGATRLKLAAYGLADRVPEINHAAVAAALRGIEAAGAHLGVAADPIRPGDAIPAARAGCRVLISGDIGPTGRLLKPYGDADPEAVLDAYREQTAVLAQAGVDAFSIETMMDLEEARLAIRATKEAAPSLPVFATMTFDRTPRGFFTIMGVSVAKAAAGLAGAGADVIGANCGHGSEEMLAVAREFGEHTKLPLIIQPNAGLPEMRDGCLVYAETPEFMADMARRFVEAGVQVLGACCGSTPEHIRALRAVADAAGPKLRGGA